MIRYYLNSIKFPKKHHLIRLLQGKHIKTVFTSGLVVCLLVSILYLSTPLSVHANSIDVPCGIGDLRDAITQANENAGPDTLELSDGCIYMLFSGPYQSGNGPDGLPVITTEVTIQGESATIARSTQSGVPEFRILELSSSANISLYHLTISGGSLTDPHTATTGGGIYNNGGRLTLDNVVLSNNHAGDAGGIRALSGSITTILGSTISGNTSTSNQSTGGGIQNHGDLTIVNSVLSANAAHQGGAIYNKNNLTIKNSTVTGNSSVDGAGIYNDGGIVAISNATFYANSATGNGGGIFSSASLTLINATFYKNSANVGGGIYNLGSSGAALVKNSIIATSSHGSNCHGSFSASSTHNLLWPATDPTCAGQYGDPKLNSMGKYGGPTPTLSLKTTSNALDAGDDNVCLASPINNTDQRGSPRPTGPHCDIGAFEGSIDLRYIYLPLNQK